MHSITAASLRNAHGGESMAHMRYTVWGGCAHEEELPNVARLFRAIASAETINASNLETASCQGEKGAQQSFHYALSAEKEHAAMFKKAKQFVDSGKDAELGAVHVCLVCGWTYEGDLPEVCPICGAKADMFKTFA